MVGYYTLKVLFFILKIVTDFKLSMLHAKSGNEEAFKILVLFGSPHSFVPFPRN